MDRPLIPRILSQARVMLMSPTRLTVMLMTAMILCAPFAAAQSGVGISPPRAELFAQPGDQVTQVVDVDNSGGSSAVSATVSPSDALMMPDGKVVFVAPGAQPNSLTSWLSIDPLRFELAIGEHQAVTYTANVPPSTPDGTYWGVLFFETEPPETTDQHQDGVGVQSRVRVGHIIYITVGTPTHEGTIVGIRYDAGGQGAEAVRVTFHNTGTGLLRLNGHVEVRSTTGDLLQTLTLDGAASFPGAEHDLVFPLTSPLAGGDYVVLASLDYGSGQVLVGDATVSVK